MIQKESRLDVADNSGAKVAMVIGTKGKSTARGRFTRIAVGIGDRVTCTVKKSLPNADIKTGDKVQAVIVRTKYPTRRDDGSYVRFDSNACVIVDDADVAIARTRSERSARGTGGLIDRIDRRIDL